MYPVINCLSNCPSHIAIVGGGRWARVLTEVLSEIVSKDIVISIYSLHNGKGMISWVLEKKFRQSVTVYDDFPNLSNHKVDAMIVANSASDHVIAIQKSLNSKIPVLVEKPVTMSYSSTLQMVKLAQEKKTFLASAHVFLFNRYLSNFSQLVFDSGGLKSIQIEWSDPISENRHGEQKNFDPSLPIFFDLLPHILSIINVIVGKKSIQYTNLIFHKGGSEVEIELMLEGVFCSVNLARNSNVRKRIINIMSDQHLQLDFSQEPGVIKKESLNITGDEKWDLDIKPVAQMLSAFLVQSAGGKADLRLDIDLGLEANKLIDETLLSYNNSMISWLKSKLIAPVIIDDDLQYALREILLVNGYFLMDAELMIDRIQKVFSEDSTNYWLDRLNNDTEPFELIRKIASG